MTAFRVKAHTDVPRRRNRPISVYRSLLRALTLCPQLCMGIQPDARFPAPSAHALPATLYGHLTQAYTEVGLFNVGRVLIVKNPPAW